MKSFNGEPKNISTDIIGSITMKNWNWGKGKILYTETPSVMEKNFAAVIGTSNVFPSTHALIVAHKPNLCEGDVVKIDSEGNATVIICSKSKTNAIVIQNECNANCIMCPQAKDKSKISWQEIASIIKATPKNIESIGITGGEPTIDKDKLLKTIDLFNRTLP